jgi:hypothetical protein
MRIPAAALLALITSIAVPSLAHAESSSQAITWDDEQPRAETPAPSSGHADAPPTFAEPSAPSAPAKDAPSRFERPFAVQGAFGLLGGPTGIASVLVDYAPSPWFVTTVGFGIGGNASLQYAASARLRLPISAAVALGLGGGLSGGGYTPVLQGLFAEGEFEEVTYGNVLWGNAEISLEVQSKSGFYFRTIFGASQSIVAGSTSCVRYQSGKPTGPSGACHQAHEGAGSLPYVTLAFGKSFSI